jgi:ketosteroid isomerase-like protein
MSDNPAGDPSGSPKDVVRRFFATLGTGNFAAIGEFFTDDSVWMVNDVARGFPAQRGRAAIIDDFLQPVREGLFEPGDPKIEIRRLLGEDDWVVAETTARGTLRNGNHYENAYVFVIQVAGDTVRFLREYMDSDYAHSVSAGAGSAGAGSGGDDGDHVAETLRRLGHD